MTPPIPREPLDDDEICWLFAQHPNSEGYTEAEFRQVMTDLLARGIIRRVPYRTPDGTVRYRIERAPRNA